LSTDNVFEFIDVPRNLNLAMYLERVENTAFNFLCDKLQGSDKHCKNQTEHNNQLSKNLMQKHYPHLYNLKTNGSPYKHQ